MILVERHIITDNRFEDLCLRSGLLYNYTLYNIRQGIFSGEYLKEYSFSTKCCRENQPDFRALPCHVSQQVIKQVFQAISLWRKQRKDYEKNPGKYRSKPKLPGYKKGKKQNMLVFTASDCKIKNDGCIHFVRDIISPVRTNVKKDEIKQVRIIPHATCYVIEVIYEREEQDLGLSKENVLSIDLGLNNLCTGISNVGVQPFIVNGRIIKSFNQWFNKLRAKLMSFVGDRGTSRRLYWLYVKRNSWVIDKMHKISRWIINFCVKNNIGTIVIGLNKGWKNGIELGKRMNQKFVEIPFSKLIDKIVYKAKLLGIDVIVHEESYTSKIDHFAFESFGHKDVYLGKRKKRGLFQSSTGVLLNADVNGAIGIGRKVFGDSFVRTIVDSGLAFNPVRVNIL